MSVTCISLVSSSSVPIRRLSAAAPRWLKLLWIQTVLSCHCNNTIGWYGARYELFNQSSLALQTFQFKTQVIHWWGASICRLHRLQISGRLLYLPVAADLIFPDSPACLGWYGCKKWTYTTWCLVQFGPRCPANHQIGAYWTVMREVMWLMLLETWFGGNEDGEHQSQLIQICFLVCVSSTLMLSALYWLYVTVLILSTGRHYFFFLSSHTLLTSLTLFQLTDKQSIPPQS